MRIILLRHGKAVSSSEVGGVDEHRYLTQHGRQQARLAGQWLSGRSELSPGRVWVSPLVRAVQTAELAVGVWGAPGVVESKRALGLQDNSAVMDSLMTLGGGTTVLLVGHLPQMGDLARILAGQPDIASPTPGTAIVLQGRPEPDGCIVAARFSPE